MYLVCFLSFFLPFFGCCWLLRLEAETGGGSGGTFFCQGAVLLFRVDEATCACVYAVVARGFGVCAAWAGMGMWAYGHRSHLCEHCVSRAGVNTAAGAKREGRDCSSVFSACASLACVLACRFVRSLACWMRKYVLVCRLTSDHHYSSAPARFVSGG